MAERVKDSVLYQEDETIIDTITFGRGEYRDKELLHIEWQKEGTSLKILPKQTDFSGYGEMICNMVFDSASEWNQADTQSFTLELVDKAGNRCRMSLPQGAGSLKKTPGYVDRTSLEEGEIIFWSRSSPICSIRIPMEKWNGVDLSRIDSIIMRFDQTESGSLYLENIVME